MILDNLWRKPIIHGYRTMMHKILKREEPTRKL